MKKKRKNIKKIKGQWLPFTQIFKDKNFHLIILLTILLWVILLQVVYTTAGGRFTLPSSDGYVILRHAKAWYEGHPLSLYPEDPPVAKNPVPYAMLLSIGHFLGFKSLNAFIFWTYLINLIMLLGSILFLYRFFNRFFPEVAFPSTLLTALFAPLFYNSFSCTTFPLLFLLSSGALAFLESFPFFISFALLTGFSRSEGIMYYFFLSSLHLGLNRKNILKLLIFTTPLFCPLLINRLLIGQKISQGTVSQMLFHYDSFTNILEIGAVNFTHHLKATILGLYKPGEDFGLQMLASSIFTLPPLFFIFSAIGFFQKDKKLLAIVTVIFLTILLVGDSLILFTGIGYNRHLLLVLPLVFAFSFLGIEKINKKIEGFFPAATAFFSLFFICQETLMFVYIKRDVEAVRRGSEVVQWMDENLPHGTEIFDGTRGRQFISFEATNLRLIPLTPNINPIFGKYTNSFWMTTENSELIQRFYTDTKYILTAKINNKKDFLLISWLQNFSVGNPRLFSWIGVKEKYGLFTLDLSPLTAQRFEEESIIDEVDVGDPVSESLHDYKRINITGFRFRHLLQNIDGVYDAARVIEGYESFDIELSQKDKNILVFLLGNHFEGERVALISALREVDFELEDPYYEIYINGQKISEDKIEKDHKLVKIQIPQEINKNRAEILVKGRFISYHYWILKDKQ